MRVSPRPAHPFMDPFFIKPHPSGTHHNKKQHSGSYAGQLAGNTGVVQVLHARNAKVLSPARLHLHEDLCT